LSTLELQVDLSQDGLRSVGEGDPQNVGRRAVDNVVAGLSIAWSNDRWAIGASALAGVVGEAPRWSEDDLVFEASAYAAWLASAELALSLGAVVYVGFEYVFVLPVLGVSWQPSPHFGLVASLPEKIEALVWLTEFLAIRAALEGDYQSFVLHLTPEPAFIEYVPLRAGLGVLLAAVPGVDVLVAGGVGLDGLVFAEPAFAAEQDELEPVPYVQVGLQLTTDAFE